MSRAGHPGRPAAAADRALREFAAALAESRPRRSGDAADPLVPVAATVVLARDTADGPEVLLIERPDRGSFAGAWVFPGGKVDQADSAVGASEEDDARRAAVRETAEETGLVIEERALVTLSCWDPPPGLALRIRTWFFVTPAPDAPLALSPGEAVAAQWSRPGDVLAAHGRGELTLYPPTWVTLHTLADRDVVADIIDAARIGGIRHYETVARPGAEGPILLWQDDAHYDADEGAESRGARHRLEVGALPWRYQHTR